ncbi:hypothetical protein TWF281_011009 [Arthrobotrys megalospora]
MDPILPVELEIEIIGYLPFAQYASLGQVCKRWQAITRLPDLLYVPITTQRQASPPSSFKEINFRIHKAIYQVADYWGDSVDISGYRIPKHSVRRLVSPYLDNQLTIPPLPHTLQDIKLHIAMPPNPSRPSGPGYKSKVVTVPCKAIRKLILAPDPTDTNKIEITDLNGKRDVTGITVGEYFESLNERGRIRRGDTFSSVDLRWRVRNMETDWWWKDWDIGVGIYELLLVKSDKAVEGCQVWYQSA